MSVPQSSSKIRLAFASDRAGNGDIFLMDAQRRLTNLTNSAEGDWDPVWSPDGRMLAYTSHRDDQTDIWLMAADGTQARNLTNHSAWDYAPAWSPDGQTILFVSQRDGEAELYTQHINEDTAQQITFNDYPDKLPNWTPDGENIVFASVIDGFERLYTLNLAQPQVISPLLPYDISGTNPVYHPDGLNVAFVGWFDHDEINIFVLDMATRKLDRVYASDQWIGSLNWSSDGNWLLFTSRPDDHHDLMMVNRHTKRSYRLTDHAAWDDFPALHPADHMTTPMATPIESTTSIVKQNPVHFGYGVNLADLSNAYLINDIGFNYIKGFVNWASVEQREGIYRWTDPDNILRAAEGANAKILLRIHGVPAWARPADTSLSYPPTNLADFERFMRILTKRYRGKIAAYEVWNEPNLNYEWGYRDPSPTEYTALLKTAYRAIKAEDPNALVISAGLAPTGDGNPPEVLGVLDFVDGMYTASAKGHFDAMGSHPYTYGHAPDFSDADQITFDQLLDLRQLMVNYGDGDTPIWITEMGWVLNTHWDLGAYHDQGVSQLDQAAYIRRAYEKIETDWPWVEAAFLFNLDFSTAPWYTASEQMRWFAIMNPDRTPRPAFTALGAYRREGVGVGE